MLCQRCHQDRPGSVRSPMLRPTGGPTARGHTTRWWQGSCKGNDGIRPNRAPKLTLPYELHTWMQPFTCSGAECYTEKVLSTMLVFSQLTFPTSKIF